MLLSACNQALISVVRLQGKGTEANFRRETMPAAMLMQLAELMLGTGWRHLLAGFTLLQAAS